MNDLRDILIEGHETLRTALERMNCSGKTILLLTDAEGVLLRTITDGDLRRVILAGDDLSSHLSSLPPITSWTVPQGTSTETVLNLMNEHGLDQIPVLDEQGCPTDIHLRRELDQPILLSTPHLSEHEREFVEQAFATNWIAPIGPNLDAFEAELAAEVGCSHAAALTTGTAAIHLGLELLGVGPGDKVFTSSLTFVATANPILYVGAEPVFIDSEPETWNMSPAALERAMIAADQAGELPKVVMPVGLYGQSPDMEAIVDICDRYGVAILEDAAESLGATYQERHAGTFGHLGIYSFNGNKIITTSGGGMLVSNDGEMIDKARFLATQAREPAPYYQHTTMGFNYRMSNILAGVGRGQLKVLSERVNQRRAVYDRYHQELLDTPGISWMPEPTGHRATRWLSAGLIDPNISGITAPEVIQKLAAYRIEARRVWKPMHLQPLFANAPYWAHHEGESISDDLFAHGICLPSGSNLLHHDQLRVTDQLKSIFHEHQPQSNVHLLNLRAG